MEVFFWVILIFTASLIYSSNKLLFNPVNKVWGAKIFVGAQPVMPISVNHRFLTFLYNLYIYMVFDTSYLRVTQPGKFFKFYSLSFCIIFLLKILMYLVHPLIRYMFYIKYIFLHQKSHDFWEFLYINYDNIGDKRYLLYRLENGWNHNPKLDFKAIFTKLKLINPNITNSEALYANILNKTSMLADDIHNANFHHKIVILKLPDIKTVHPAIVNTGVTNYNTSHILITDFSKANNKVFYNKEIIIPKIFIDKPSTGLAINENIIREIQTTTSISNSTIAQSFIDYRFDSAVLTAMEKHAYTTDIISPNITNIIHKKLAHAKYIHNLMLDEGYDADTIKQTIDYLLHILN